MKKNTRTLKELLQIMLDNQEYFSTGLCWWVERLHRENIISLEESYKLLDYIDKNKPSIFFSTDAFKNRNSSYYWTIYNIKPRIKWLKKHIKKELIKK